jgi:hypothetical protein
VECYAVSSGIELSTFPKYDACQYMALRLHFGSKRRFVVEGWIKFYVESGHNLYTSPNIIRMVKGKLDERCV